MPAASTDHVTFDLPTATLDQTLTSAEWMLRDGMAAEDVERWARTQLGRHLKVRVPALAGGRGVEIFGARSASPARSGDFRLRDSRALSSVRAGREDTTGDDADVSSMQAREAGG